MAQGGARALSRGCRHGNGLRPRLRGGASQAGGGAWWEAEPGRGGAGQGRSLWEAESGRGGVGQGAGLAARRGGATSQPLGAGGLAQAAYERRGLWLIVHARPRPCLALSTAGSVLCPRPSGSLPRASVSDPPRRWQRQLLAVADRHPTRCGAPGEGDRCGQVLGLITLA